MAVTALSLARRRGRARSAFSVVELMVVVTILALIAGISVYGWQRSLARAEQERARFCFLALNQARTQYLGEHPFVNPKADLEFLLIAPYLARSKQRAPRSLEEYTTGTGEGRVWILGAWGDPIECKPAID